MQATVARTQEGAFVDYRWDDLRVFLALFRHRTLAGAGAKVGLDASTVSRRLAGLEEALGATLFDRTRDGVLPTAAAEQLLAAAEEAENAAQAVARLAEGLERAPEGTVRITAPPLLVDAFLAPAIPSFRSRFPRLQLELLASASFADLTRREADIALRMRRPTTGDLISVRVAAIAGGVFVSPAYAAARGVISSWDEVEWAAWTEDLAHFGASQWLTRHAPEAPIAVRSTSLAALLAVCVEGGGAVITTALVARKMGLVPLAIAPALLADLRALPVEEMWIVGHRALRNVPRIQVTWSFLLDELLPGLRGDVGETATLPTHNAD